MVERWRRLALDLAPDQLSGVVDYRRSGPGAIVTVEHAAALQVLVPRLRVANIAGAGHSIRRDQFDPYLETVRAFLRETASVP